MKKALNSGASAYLLKESATEEVIHAIREVHKGRCFLSPAVSRFVVKGFRDGAGGTSATVKSPELTGRETEILQLIAEGLTSKDIAKALELSVNTVHVHRNNIMRKLDVHTQAEMIRYALKEGIARL